LDVIDPVLAEPTIGMQHQQPAVLRSLHTPLELLSSSLNRALHNIGAPLMGHLNGFVGTATIDHNDLEGIGPPLEICQEEGEVPRFIEGGNHHG
jgi:hypothetical protein